MGKKQSASTRMAASTVSAAKASETLMGRLTLQMDSAKVSMCVWVCVISVSLLSSQSSYPSSLVLLADINECTDTDGFCGPAANCSNLIGSYKCTCHFGYTNNSSKEKCKGEKCLLIFFYPCLQLIGTVLRSQNNMLNRIIKVKVDMPQ